MPNTLTDPFIRALLRDDSQAALSLPGVLAEAMRADGHIAAFPALRAHQRHAWHAFLAQSGALATLAVGRVAPPETEEEWRAALRALTRDYPDDAPWRLVAPPDQPALLQPLLPGGDIAALKNRLATPDELDMLVTARNHDLKRAVMTEAQPEDWLFALVTLQTMEGFLGAGNYGISRMNGGFANRPALGIAPVGGSGAHIRRDILRLLELRDELREALADQGYALSGGIALVWLEPWDGTTSLRRNQLDPYYIEICRRVRLLESGGRIAAVVGGSKTWRIEEPPGGITGDPWAPLVIEKRGARQGPAKVFTPDAAGFGYRRMVQLMAPDTGLEAPMQRPAKTEPAGDLTLLARALVRGQGKTEGYHERRVRVPRKIVGSFLRGRSNLDRLGQSARRRVEEAGIVSWSVLRPALLALFEDGPEMVDARNKDAERKARAYLDRFEILVDRDFFSDLWSELELEDPDARAAKRREWISKLLGLAEDLLRDADERTAKSTRRRYRARVRAHAVLHGAARRNPKLQAYLAGQADAA